MTADAQLSCLFCKIASGAVPCRKVDEDQHLLAFYDIHPRAPVHFLVIPKIHIATLYDCKEQHSEVLGHLVMRLGALAKIAGLDNGFRTIANTGHIGRQEVFHLHFHILGGPAPLAPGLLASETPGE